MTKMKSIKEENEIPKYIAEEFLKFHNRYKPNSNEIGTMNLGDQECVKEIKITVHLNEAQKNI